MKFLDLRLFPKGHTYGHQRNFPITYLQDGKIASKSSTTLHHYWCL
jgi:hypothetical protein